MVIFKYNENPLFHSLVIKLAFVQQTCKLKQKIECNFMIIPVIWVILHLK